MLVFATANHFLSPFVKRYDDKHRVYCEQKMNMREVFNDLEELRLGQSRISPALSQERASGMTLSYQYL